MKKKHVLWILLAAVILFTGGTVYQSYRKKWAEEKRIAHMKETVEHDTFYEGTYLDNTALKGLTLPEAKKQFSQRPRSGLQI